ncbi:TetR/AcrR family transcriptional regulator [Kineosporia babensis]|uniref:TetR/AcrR family transcriptional regulator n=1 Tax=Kineosporia babensis TaxID=499548 RepID=A0A9X1NEY1_9ACTN|nr:TetR/AcrR family transcriptional regulator [Kineosporia babensis]MCD5312424.1 TetR/AcrR family transcriptional regulator [Kineosporia babensis]
MSAKAPTARELARESVRANILRAARARLADEGPAQLSLRAVARDVGMVSSAVYRYFPSRDDLLTALLVEAYDELGAAAEQGDASHPREQVGARWVAAGRAIRAWSLAHPSDFALLFGSPVPGYSAPRDTVTPATRAILVLIGIVIDATGTSGWRSEAAVTPATAPAPVASVVGDALDFLEARGQKDAAPPEMVLRTLSAWTTVFGTVSFELFGHYTYSVSDLAGYFDQVLARLADELGFDAQF